MPKYIFFFAMFLTSSVWGQMTYEGRLTANESRAWFYGSLAVFVLILIFAYNLHRINPWVADMWKKIRDSNHFKSL